MDSIDYLKLFLTRDLLLCIIAETGDSVEEAMTHFFTSPFFEKLQDTETGLYQESSAYLHHLYNEMESQR
jgi:hypothetical protein